MSPATPAPIDPRGPRTNQAVLAVGLLLGFAAGWWPIAPLFAAVLFVGAAFGPRYGPVLALYRVVLRPRLGPPEELEDPRPPRFAATLGIVVLGLATIAFALGSAAFGWGLTLLVAGLAGLSALSGICVGCELYLAVARRRGVELAA